MPTIFFKDFPTIEVPPVALELGMIDVSWHNDAGPRMIHHTQKEADNGTETPILTFFCGGEMMKAEVDHGYFVGWAAYGYADTGDGRPYYQGDDLEAALKFLEEQAAPLARCVGAQGPDGKPACHGEVKGKTIAREWEGGEWLESDWCEGCIEQALFLGWEIKK